LELARALDWKPHLVHANDWHTGAAIYWLQTTGRSDPFFGPVATLITVHNLPYLGDGAGDALRGFDLLERGEENTSPSAWLPEWARDAILPLALAYADIITTVSPSYAEEIRTPEFGCGLENLLQARRKRLHGILNGLDTKQLDPARDPALESSFDSSHLERRARNKQALQQQRNLAQTRAPLLGVVSRLDYQKGLDLALPALARWVEEGGQVVVLGTGDPELEKQYRELSGRNPTQVAVALEYNAKLASRVYAGADLLLMPSRYEPCGLSQMIAMRYGCIPVVRSVGGLRDTVRDVESGRGTGFVFSGVNGEGMAEALKRARAVFAQPRRWQVIQRRAMRQDFSWGKSARAYLVAYRRAMTLHNSRSLVHYKSGSASERRRS
jgi:starch synthase